MVALAKKHPALAGIYTVKEASRLAMVSSRMFTRWVNGNAQGAAAVKRYMPESPSGVVSFVDYVQARAIRTIRRERFVDHPDKPGEQIRVAPSLQQIRQAVEEAEKMGFPYPFARQHTTFVFNDDIVVKLEDGAVVTLTGKYKAQHLIEPIVEPYLFELEFGENGLASRDTPLSHGDRSIVIDPKVKYGTPIVMPCGVSVSALVHAIDEEGGIQGAADAYGVDPKDVKIALKYEDILSGIAS